MNNTQKVLKNQHICEQATPNLGITQSSGLERHTAMIPATWGGTGWWTACPPPGKAGRGIPGGDCAYTGTAPAGDALMGRRAA